MRFFRRSKVYRSAGLSQNYWRETIDRQEKAEGTSYPVNQATRILVPGAGANGANYLHHAPRKGYRYFEVLDDDIVEFSNLPHQGYSRSDVGKYKVHALGKRVVTDALFPVEINARPFRFQELYDADEPITQSFDAIVCLVDNDRTRLAVTEFGFAHCIPVVHAAVSRDASSLYVFVQEPDHACGVCAFPNYLENASYPCQLPAVIDASNVVTGLVLYAVDSLVSGRPRDWNYRRIHLHGGLSDQTRIIERKPDCPVCSQATWAQPASAYA